MAQETQETTRISAAEEAHGESDRPPSYNSIYGRLKSVKEGSSGPKDFFTKSYDIVCTSIVLTILLAPFIAIPVALIAVGSVHLNHCPAERYIPIYMIVAGCFGVLQGVMSFAIRVRRHWEEKKTGGRDAEGGGGRRREGEEEETGARGKLDGFRNGLLSCFLFAWFIAGSVWVYSIYGSVNTWDSTSVHYCHPSVYWFAFVLLTCGYVFIALSCCVAACCGLIFCLA